MSATFTTIGKLCCELQTRPAQLERIARELGIQPSMTLNGLAYYSEESCELIAIAAREQGLIPGNPISETHRLPRAGGVHAAAVSVG